MRKTFNLSALSIFALVVYIFLFLPIAVLVTFSFNQERINVIWTGFTFKWYASLLYNEELISAAGRSLAVAFSSTLLSGALGTLAGLALARHSFWGKRFFEAVLHLPIVMPDIVLSIAMLSFYVMIQFTLGLLSIIVAHATFNMAYVAVLVRARVFGLDGNIENAAMDLGATPSQTFWYVTLPLTRPAIIAGSLLAFTLSWDDFMIAFFTSGVGSTTLPLKVYSMVKFGVSPEINAISTITIFFTMLLLFISTRFRNRSPGENVEQFLMA